MARLHQRPRARRAFSGRRAIWRAQGIAVDRIGTRTVDPLFNAVLWGLCVLVVAAIINGSARLAEPSLDLSLDTLTTVIAVVVAILAIARVRDREDAMPLFQAAAFVVLAVARIARLEPRLADLVELTATGGVAIEASRNIGLVAAALASVVLVAGGLSASRPTPPARRRLIIFGPAAALGVAIIVRRILALTGGAAETGQIVPAAGAVAVLQLGIAAMFVWAAKASFAAHRRGRLIGDAYVVVALVLAAIAEVHATIDPQGSTGVLTVSDFFGLAFYVVLVVGLGVDVRGTVARLRDTSRILAIRHDADLQRAALEERARLSRELHDGLAQDLWIAKLKLGRLTGLADLSPEARELAGELGAAVDAGLAEARQAVMALRLRDAGSFAELLAAYIDDFCDAFSVRAEFAFDPDLPLFAPRTEAELMRIVQEALNNARRHADATVVRVEVHVVNHELHLSVADNGRGFQPGATRKGGFGLTSMRERASLIGGDLTIASQPEDGTRVELKLPLAAATAAPKLVRR